MSLAVSQEEIRLFGPIAERVNVWNPIIVLILIGFEVTLGFRLIPADIIFWEAYVLIYIFLNAVHNVSTLAMVLSFPEAKEWIAGKTRGQPWRFWTKLGLSALLLFIIFFIGAGRLPVENVARFQVFLMLSWIQIAVASHHGLTQTMGISLRYNEMIRKKFALTPEEIVQASRVEAIERAGFKILIALVFPLQLLQLQGVRSIAPFLPFQNRSWPAMLLSAATSAGILYLIVNCWRFPRVSSSNKPAYLLRLLAFPLLQVSSIAAFIIVVSHIIEYQFVFLKMMKKSCFERSSLQLWSAAALIVSLALAGMRMLVNAKWRNPSLEVQLVASLALTILYLHYHLDGMIFSRKEPAIRRLRALL